MDIDQFLELAKARRSIRLFKPDPIPDGYVEKILEAARWAMSGANSQPWEFIVVRDPDIKRQLRDAYSEYNTDYIFWMEQQRLPDLRHPVYQVKGDTREQLEFNKKKANWHLAPAIIVVLGDGRRQWGTVMGAHTFGREQSHLTDGLANASFLIHLTVASLGLTSEWVTIHIQEPFKRILGVPDLLKLYLIIPIGLPDVGPRPGVRRRLDEMVHYDRYDMSKYMSNEQIIQYLYSLREATVPVHSSSRGIPVEEK